MLSTVGTVVVLNPAVTISKFKVFLIKQAPLLPTLVSQLLKYHCINLSQVPNQSEKREINIQAFRQRWMMDLGRGKNQAKPQPPLAKPRRQFWAPPPPPPPTTQAAARTPTATARSAWRASVPPAISSPAPGSPPRFGRSFP